MSIRELARKNKFLALENLKILMLWPECIAFAFIPVFFSQADGPAFFRLDVGGSKNASKAAHREHAGKYAGKVYASLRF